MYEKKSGYLKLLSLQGIPVYFHWSFPIAGILISLYGKGSLEQTVLYILSCSLLIFIHELGHLLAAKSMNLEVFAIKISGAGGMCQCEEPNSYKSAFLVYGGGLLAQSVLLIATANYLVLFDYPASKVGFCFIITFTLVNVIMFIINIIPSKFADGNLTDGFVLLKLFRGRYGKA